MSPRAAPPRLVTVAEAAHQLSMSRDQIYRLINSGHMTSVRLPSRTATGDGPIRIEQAEIDRLIGDHRQQASA